RGNPWPTVVHLRGGRGGRGRTDALQSYFEPHESGSETIRMMRVVGTSPVRIEGRDKVTGSSKYTVDVSLPGMLVMRVLRSQVAHAELHRIDTERARAIPGVHAVITAQDIGDIRIGVAIKDMPLLATDRVRHIGEPIA